MGKPIDILHIGEKIDLRRIKSALLLFVLLSLNLFVFSLYLIPSMKAVEGTSVGGRISENTTWTLEGSPYIAVADVIVESDVVLTIKPGVIVKFASGTNLVVDGSLIAQGNSTHKITFTSNATTPETGDWGTINVRGQANISYTTVHYAGSGISFVQTGSLVDCWSDHLFISSNVYGITISTIGYLESDVLFNIYLDSVEIENNMNAGIYFDNLGWGGSSGIHVGLNSTHIRDSVISHNGYGIRTWIYGSRILLLTNCTISYNDYHGIFIDWVNDSTGPQHVNINSSNIVNNNGNGYTGYFPQSGWMKKTTIMDSVISNNSQHGVYQHGGDDISILSSSISHNGQTGVTGLYVPLNIRSSNITHNNANGVVVHEWSNIHYCNLNDNIPYIIEVSARTHYNATLNWWGTTNETIIKELIYDYYDDPSLGLVSYVPFLNSSAATLCSLTVDPIFFDITGTTFIQPSSWSIRFPDNTIRTVSSAVTYNQTRIGEYSIVSIMWKGVEVIPETTPTTLLTSDMLWSPSVNCLLPTSMIISLSSSTSYVGFKVGITGSLTYNEVGLSGAPILLSYSVTSGESWGNITLVNTASDGGYSAVWMPSATGNYLVRATWPGNSTYPTTTTAISLAVIPFNEQNVFSVTSNSTVSELAFNSTSRELSFTVTGPSGTSGYVNVYLAKTLVDNITDFKVYLDGNQLNHTATSLHDSWLLHFTYLHSTHTIAISLGPAPFIPLELRTPLSLGIFAVVLTVVTALLIFKMRRGTPPTILNGVYRKSKPAQIATTTSTREINELFHSTLCNRTLKPEF